MNLAILKEHISIILTLNLRLTTANLERLQFWVEGGEQCLASLRSGIDPEIIENKCDINLTEFSSNLSELITYLTEIERELKANDTKLSPRVLSILTGLPTNITEE